MKLGGNFLLSILGNYAETKRRQNYGQGSSWVGKFRFYSSRDEIFLHMLVFFFQLHGRAELETIYRTADFPFANKNKIQHPQRTTLRRLLAQRLQMSSDLLNDVFIAFNAW